MKPTRRGLHRQLYLCLGQAVQIHWVERIAFDKGLVATAIDATGGGVDKSVNTGRLGIVEQMPICVDVHGKNLAVILLFGSDEARLMDDGIQLIWQLRPPKWLTQILLDIMHP